MLKLATKFAPELPALEAAHRAGFRNAELWLNEEILRHAEEAIRLTRRYPFEYALHFPNRVENGPETVRHTAQLYRGVGSRCLVIHQPMFDRHGAALQEALPEGRLAIENHKLDRDQFAAWAERSPGLALDVEHIWMFTQRGASLPELLDFLRPYLARYRDKLRHVHLPGYWPGQDEHRPMYASREFVFPVLSLLAEIDFDGLIVSETHPSYQNPLDLRMDVLLFDRWRELHERA